MAREPGPPSSSATVLKLNAELAIESSGMRGARNSAAVLLRQVQPDVELTQLLRRHLRGRAPHQILGALVHRKQHDLSQVLPACEPHFDAGEGVSHAPMRLRAP